MRLSAGVCAFAWLLSIPGPAQVAEMEPVAPPHTASFVTALPSHGTSSPLSFRRRLDLGPKKQAVPSQTEPAFGMDGSEVGSLHAPADATEIRVQGDEGWFGRSPNPAAAKGSTSAAARLGAPVGSGSGHGNLGDLAGSDLDFDRIDRELWELERDYEDAAQNLFSDLSFRLIQPVGNPFDQALGKELSPLPDDQPPEPDPVAESPSEPVDEASNGPLPGPGPDTADGVLSGSPPLTGSTEVEPEDPEFAFLVIGNFGEDRSDAGVFRAFRDEVGGFVLENEFVFNLPPIVTDNNLIFKETDRIVTADLNQDGVLDFVRARIGDLGTKLESYLGQAVGGVERQAQGFAFHQTVLSMAVFDLDGDGEKELVLVTDRGSRLIVYERSADILQYRKELLLPFTPGLVVVSNPDFRGPELRVLDRELERVATLSQGFGNSFISQRFLKPSIRSMTLDSLGYGDPVEVFVFEDGKHLSLFVSADGGLVLLASLVRRPKMPLLIVGDYQGFKSRQLAFWF